MGLVDNEAGARGIKAVGLFKDGAAGGVEDIIDVANPDLGIGQATFCEGVGADAGFTTEGFGLFQFKTSGLEKIFRSQVGIVPTGGKVFLAAGIAGTGMAWALDAVFAAVAHLN